jgi:hypothetical protein
MRKDGQTEGEREREKESERNMNIAKGLKSVIEVPVVQLPHNTHRYGK